MRRTSADSRASQARDARCSALRLLSAFALIADQRGERP